jgi:hypothetical protein
LPIIKSDSDQQQGLHMTATHRLLAGVVLMGLTLGVLDTRAAEPVTLQFDRVQLDTAFRSEGVAVADFDGDGLLDIAAGPVWYQAPEWKRHAIVDPVPEYQPLNYSNSFINYANDVNGDGRTDLMVVDFPGTPTWWFENPGQLGVTWQRHELTPVSNNESPQFIDLTGDGRKEWVMGVSPDRAAPDGDQRFLAYLTPASDPLAAWAIHRISANAAPGTMKYDHGLGIGDINGDGRADVVTPAGWWQAPADPQQGPWPFHPAPLGEAAAQMYVYDFDGDGDSDVVSSSAHRYGIWWHEQTAPNQWQTHEIDRSFSQTHGLCLADMDADGLPDLVTGKRWWAHGPSGDPGSGEPAVFAWFRLTRSEGRPVWTMQFFDHDSGPGTQFEVADVNQDGRLDVATSNKKGVHLFLQRSGTDR